MAEPPQPSRPQVEHSSEDTATTTQKPLEANADADSDPDFDDLDGKMVSVFLVLTGMLKPV